jgi:hypothetical protein
MNNSEKTFWKCCAVGSQIRAASFGLPTNAASKATRGLCNSCADATGIT